LPGSPVLKAGANLTSLGITQLNLDTSDGGGRHPVARPTAGPWDAGAFQATVPVQPSK